MYREYLNNNMELNKLTISKAARALREKKISCLELTKACLKKIQDNDKDINAFITVNTENAINEAQELDSAFAKNLDLPVLAGIPFAIKDLFNTQGVKSTSGSKMLENFIPQYNAVSYKKLKEQNSILIGKTACDEFACGASGEHCFTGVTRNPHDLTRVSGGSSAGSAASVAADMCIYSIGTDTGGSIRQPASFCGVVGTKVTYGRVSRYGVTAMASSLDTIGPITKTVEDAAIVLQAIAGHDDLDSTTPNISVPNYSSFLNKNVKDLKIGVPREYFEEGIDPEIAKVVKNALTNFEKQGAILKEISLPMTKYGVSVYYIIMPTELSANLGRFDAVRYGRKSTEAFSDLIDYYSKARVEGFGDEIIRRIMIGTYVSSSGYYDAYYKKAQKVRTLVIKDFDQAFQDVDVICGPTSPITPWKFGENENNPLAEYLADSMTIPASLAGIPGISIPCGKDKSGLPVGLQILAPQFEEGRLITIGDFYEKNLI